MSNLCREAALGPLRSLPMDELQTLAVSQVRPIELNDFNLALSQIRPSVSASDLQQYVDWNRVFGSVE